MKLFHIASENVIKHLKHPLLTESGILPVFDIKELKDTDDVEKQVDEHNNYCALLGDGHSTTCSAFKAFARNNSNAGIILFDAHAGHDSLKKLVDEKILDKSNVVIVGIRSMSKEDKKFIDEHKIKNYSVKEISFEGLHEIADGVMSVARQWNKIYISVNIDVLDPAFAPGVESPEPGGVSTRELIYFIQRLKMLRNIGMADVVGFKPEDITSKIVAKIIIELS